MSYVEAWVLKSWTSDQASTVFGMSGWGLIAVSRSYVRLCKPMEH